MPSEKTPAADERSVARKHGLRELIFPDFEQIKALNRFIDDAVAASRCGGVPKTAAVMMLDFLQGVVNRQHITKGPRMSPDEFDLLQTPYYVAARTVSKIARERQDAAIARGELYQATYGTLQNLIDLLRALLAPATPWLRAKQLPPAIIAGMEVLRDFGATYPSQRRKGRAM